MTPFAIQCPKCKAELDARLFGQGAPAPCPGCTWPVETLVFPALARPIRTGAAAELVLTEGESSCFFHPQKKAVVPCHACGRFLCALCDCDLNGQHFCPGCLETGQTKGRIRNLENQRTLYDNIALALAVVPALLVVMFYFTIITAPMALYISIRHWKTPSSIIRRSRTRLVIAMVLSALQIVAWIIGLTMLFI